MHTVTITPLKSPEGSVCLFRVTSSGVSQLQARSMEGTTSLDMCDDYASVHAAVDTTSSALVCALVRNNKRSRESASDLLCGDAACLPDCSIPPQLSPRPLVEMAVITCAEPPYAVHWASAAWLDVCGFSMAEIAGDNLRCIQGPGTDRAAIKRLMEAVRKRDEFSIASLINYDKKKRPFRHSLTVRPFAASDTVTMFIAESTDVALSCGGLFVGGAGGAAADSHTVSSCEASCGFSLDAGDVLPIEMEEEFWSEVPPSRLWGHAHQPACATPVLCPANPRLFAASTSAPHSATPPPRSAAAARRILRTFSDRCTNVRCDRAACAAESACSRVRGAWAGCALERSCWR